MSKRKVMILDTSEYRKKHGHAPKGKAIWHFYCPATGEILEPEGCVDYQRARGCIRYWMHEYGYTKPRRFVVRSNQKGA